MRIRLLIALFFICFLCYLLMDYGGVRSPDSEIVFRVAESLATGKGFTVAEPLAKSPTFGIFRGVDGRLYSYFPPFESILLTPLIQMGKWINKTGWYANFPLPVSHFVDLQPLLVRVNGKIKQRWDPPEQNLDEHALRFLASWFNPLISSLTMTLFCFMLIRMRLSEIAATAVSLLCAFGTLVWPYSGTFFSEPLTTLLTLLSFYLLVKNDSDFSDESIGIRPAAFFFSGLFAGLAVLNHYSAALFVPFFLLYAIRCCRQIKQLRLILWWLVGTLPPLVFVLFFKLYDTL